MTLRAILLALAALFFVLRLSLARQKRLRARGSSLNLPLTRAPRTARQWIEERARQREAERERPDEREPRR